MVAVSDAKPRVKLVTCYVDPLVRFMAYPFSDGSHAIRHLEKQFTWIDNLGNEVSEPYLLGSLMEVRAAIDLALDREARG